VWPIWKQRLLRGPTTRPRACFLKGCWAKGRHPPAVIVAESGTAASTTPHRPGGDPLPLRWNRPKVRWGLGGVIYVTDAGQAGPFRRRVPGGGSGRLDPKEAAWSSALRASAGARRQRSSRPALVTRCACAICSMKRRSALRGDRPAPFGLQRKSAVRTKPSSPMRPPPWAWRR